MMSSVTKKSRQPRTATAAHGLRWTRGSRGGSLAGALHSMPTEASSAVVREKDKKKNIVARTSRNGSPVSTCKTELEVPPTKRQHVRSNIRAGPGPCQIADVREFSGRQNQFFFAILLCSGPHTAGLSRLSVALKTPAGAEKNNHQRHL